MTLREHIVELRNRLLISVLAIVVCTVLGWIFYDEAFRFLTQPFHTSVGDLAREQGKEPILTFPGVGDALTFRIKISALFGLVLASPVWLYQLWAFIAPGLHRNERKWAYVFAGIAAPLFATGMAVGLLDAAEGHGDPDQLHAAGHPEPDRAADVPGLRHPDDAGVRRRLPDPLVVVLLNMVGVVPAKALGKFRPYIILVIFVFAAVATPSGDPFTMCLLAIPMCLLFFAAEVISRFNDKRRARHSEELLAD